MNNNTDFLSNEKIGSFIGGLSGLSKDELKKAKVLFIQNAITEYDVAKKSYKRFLYIPVLGWAVYLLGMPFAITDFEGMKNKILNAINVWKEDLTGESFVIDNEKIQL